MKSARALSAPVWTKAFRGDTNKRRKLKSPARTGRRYAESAAVQHIRHADAQHDLDDASRREHERLQRKHTVRSGGRGSDGGREAGLHVFTLRQRG